jgi:alpha-galactosidase
MSLMDNAPRPPMGWNSWDCYGAAVREEEVRANADYMAANLKPFGWEYVVVDIQWYEAGANSSRYRKYVPLEMDEYSRLLPAPNRFPSAAGGSGFKGLADYVHGLGLKFGIHMMRGVPRQAAHAATPILGSSATARDIAHPNSICPWNTDMYGVDAGAEGAQAYYDSIFELYASWGVDFVKVDDIADSKLYGAPHLAEIALIREAMDRCGRPMVLSLSPGPAAPAQGGTLLRMANMWRITDDFWDKWDLLEDMFDRCERWYPLVGQGRWPDCDMLPLGRIGIRSVDGTGAGAGPSADRLTRFTPDEQRTMMTLWSIFRSPLMLGGELRDCDESTLELLANPEVLAVNQGGEEPRPVVARDSAAGKAGSVVWTSSGPAGSTYLALFNLGESTAEVGVGLGELGLSGVRSVRDLWLRRDIGLTEDSAAVMLPRHGSALLKLSPTPGPA